MDIGARLRHAREARGLTIDALARATRVQPRALSAIEQNDWVALPPRPYGRGFVHAYASEVGLDPEGTVRDFFSQFASIAQMPEARPVPAPRPAAPERLWFWSFGAVIAYAAIAALVILAGRWALQRASEPGAVATSGASVPAPTAAVERQLVPAPPVAAPVTGVTILLSVDRPAWVTATADGERTIYRTLQPGERINLTAERNVTIRTGDAGALKWQVNGRPAVPMGNWGEVRTVTVTPENAAQVK